MDLYFFDFDKTLYAYDFHFRLPALSVMTGASQYHLAKTWWAEGFEVRAHSAFMLTSSPTCTAFHRPTYWMRRSRASPAGTPDAALHL